MGKTDFLLFIPEMSSAQRNHTPVDLTSWTLHAFMLIRPLFIASKASLSEPDGLSLLLLPLLLASIPNISSMLMNFHSLLSNPLIVTLLWLNFVSATKIPVLFFAMQLSNFILVGFSPLPRLLPLSKHHHSWPKMIHRSRSQVSLLLPLPFYHAFSTLHPEWSL